MKLVYKLKFLKLLILYIMIKDQWSCWDVSYHIVWSKTPLVFNPYPANMENMVSS